MKKRAIEFFKIFIFINISLNIYNQMYITINDEKTLDYYTSYTLCKLLKFKLDYYCMNNLLYDSNFIGEEFDIDTNINIFVNLKKTKIENILLLIGLIPFLKNDSFLLYKINDIEIYRLCKIIFKNKTIKNKIIKLNENDIVFLKEKLKVLLYYKWEIIPNKNLLNCIRYIINNYYNEYCLEIFDKSLNLNFKNYIKKKRNKLSLKDIHELMSNSFYYIILFL